MARGRQTTSYCIGLMNYKYSGPMLLLGCSVPCFCFCIFEILGSYCNYHYAQKVHTFSPSCYSTAEPLRIGIPRLEGVVVCCLKRLLTTLSLPSSSSKPALGKSEVQFMTALYLPYDTYLMTDLNFEPTSLQVVVKCFWPRDSPWTPRVGPHLLYRDLKYGPLFVKNSSCCFTGFTSPFKRTVGSEGPPFRFHVYLGRVSVDPKSLV